jgi:methylamine dehydrogenase accessory protein MauD
MTQSRTETLLLMLMGVVILLMIANVGLFLRMNQLQREVLAALQPLQAMSSRPEGLEIGTQSPDFVLPDIEGHQVSVRDFAGQKVLLGFLSPRCPACAGLFPALGEFAKEREEVRLVVVFLGPREEVQRVVEEEGFVFPVLMGDEEVGKVYQVPGTPFFYLLNERGFIANKGGANTLEHLERLVEVGER